MPLSPHFSRDRQRRACCVSLNIWCPPAVQAFTSPFRGSSRPQTTGRWCCWRSYLPFWTRHRWILRPCDVRRRRDRPRACHRSPMMRGLRTRRVQRLCLMHLLTGFQTGRAVRSTGRRFCKFWQRPRRPERRRQGMIWMAMRGGCSNTASCRRQTSPQCSRLARRLDVALQRNFRRIQELVALKQRQGRTKLPPRAVRNRAQICPVPRWDLRRTRATTPLGVAVAQVPMRLSRVQGVPWKQTGLRMWRMHRVIWTRHQAWNLWWRLTWQRVPASDMGSLSRGRSSLWIALAHRRKMIRVRCAGL